MYTEGTPGADRGSEDARVVSLESFKEGLVAAGVSPFEIIWGNYADHYHEVPQHLMSRYLHHRSTHLHRRALSIALCEEAFMDSHPFAC